MKTFLAWVIVLAIGALPMGCGSSVERQACYAKNEASAVQRAEVECFAKGYDWDHCPMRAPILASLAKAHKECP